jgi:hypothetical protein
MATHGTILITDLEEEILLQTSHDGHTAEAIALICELPCFVATHKWYADVLKYEEKIEREDVEDFGKRNGDFGYLWLLGVAHDIVCSQYGLWQIIPKEFQKYLALYDLNAENHLKVILNPFQHGEQVDGILILTNFEEYQNDTVKWIDNKPILLKEKIEELNQNLIRKIDVLFENDHGNKGIFIPFYDMLVDEVVEEVRKRKEK